MAFAYDTIGQNYAFGRRPDPRWERAVLEALGDANSIINVGAGTGSYEPVGRVVAVEPSMAMIQQRGQREKASVQGNVVVRGRAESLPFPDNSFDAALAVLTIHHWTDMEAGLSELRRVANRQVILTFNPLGHQRFWLCRDYLPDMGAGPLNVDLSIERIGAVLSIKHVIPLFVPRDMIDGVLAAHWCRPEAYLDPQVRANASGLAQKDQQTVDEAIEHLRSDLANGTWARRNNELATLTEFDAGYQLLIAESR